MSIKNTTDFTPDILGKANELINELNNEQIAWLGGYLSGVGLNNSTSEFKPNKTITNNEQSLLETSTGVNLKILVGSHSGNSKKIAASIAKLITDNNGTSEIVNMADYKPREINKEKNLLIIVSTHGEGEPPIAAEDLYKFLNGKRVGTLSNINYTVIALGDSSYKYYCKIGIDFHEKLKAHGANALAEPVLLDTNFSDNLITLAQDTFKLFKPTGSTDISSKITSTTAIDQNNNIYEAEILKKIQLNKKGSNKETFHIELSLEGSGFKYKPGDALEVFPINDSKLVQAIIRKLGFNIRKIVNIKGENVTLLQALTNQCEVTVVTLQVLKQLAKYNNDSELNNLLEDHDKASKISEGIDLLDLLEKYKLKLTPQQLVDALRPLPPRAYSISSAQSEADETVHITVAPVRYDKNNRLHNGAASTYFADRLKIGEGIAVRIKQNEGFKLPNKNVPIIMIGAGTGIAPYRAFIQERSKNNHSGKNWLFFGNQHSETDFLYQAEWLNYQENGLLTNIDTAFSRDQDHKIYVQHKIKEKASEIYQWIEEGAHIYVCGDRKNMAPDVKYTLSEVIQSEGNLNKEQADEMINQLRKQNRYQEDIY